MNFSAAKNEIVHLLSRVDVGELPKLIQWMKNSEELDDWFMDNEKVVLQSIAEDLRTCLPVEAMLPSESLAIEKAQQNSKPTVHVDAFLYDEEAVDLLCEEGKMSRDYCLLCGSHRTAPLGFISHSFSALELRFLFQNVLPDLSGKMLVDVGSRLGAVLYGGCLYSSAAQLVGVEISAEFANLQRMVVEKYGFTDRVQVIHADICTQASLLQNADVIVMNNVFEYFLESTEQMRAWHCIGQNVRKKGALLVTVPSVQEAFSALQGLNGVIDINQWLEEVPLDYDVYLGKDTDPESFKQIHLYKMWTKPRGPSRMHFLKSLFLIGLRRVNKLIH